MGLEITWKEKKSALFQNRFIKTLLFSPALNFAFISGAEKTDVAVPKLTPHVEQSLSVWFVINR